MTATQPTIHERWRKTYATLALRPWLTDSKANAGNRGVYKYLGLDTLVDEVRKECVKNGLVFSQTITRGSDGQPVMETMVSDGGETLTLGQYPMSMIADPQGFGGAVTYARRYSLYLILGIFPEKDDDGRNAAQIAYGGIGSRKWDRLKAMLMKAGYTAPAQRRQYLEQVLGQPVQNAALITDAQAQTVMDSLDQTA